MSSKNHTENSGEDPSDIFARKLFIIITVSSFLYAGAVILYVI